MKKEKYVQKVSRICDDVLCDICGKSCKIDIITRVILDPETCNDTALTTLVIEENVFEYATITDDFRKADEYGESKGDVEEYQICKECFYKLKNFIKK